MGELRPCLQKHHGTFWKPNGLNPSFGVRSEFSGGTFGKPVIGRSHVLYDGSMPAEIPRSAILRLFFGWCRAKVEDALVICRTPAFEGQRLQFDRTTEGYARPILLGPLHQSPPLHWDAMDALHCDASEF